LILCARPGFCSVCNNAYCGQSLGRFIGVECVGDCFIKLLLLRLFDHFDDWLFPRGLRRLLRGIFWWLFCLCSRVGICGIAPVDGSVVGLVDLNLPNLTETVWSPPYMNLTLTFDMQYNIARTNISRRIPQRFITNPPLAFPFKSADFWIILIRYHGSGMTSTSCMIQPLCASSDFSRSWRRERRPSATAALVTVLPKVTLWVFSRRHDSYLLERHHPRSLQGNPSLI
jgi:hypothetical protein